MGKQTLYNDLTINGNAVINGSTFSATGSITGNSIVKSGGTSAQFLKADGSIDANIYALKSETFDGYDYEIHVSQIDGDDTTGNGDLLTPVASITKALTLVGSGRKTIVIHPGGYTENPSITVQYTTLTTYEQLGANTVIYGTLSTSTGCTISGLKMTNLTVTAAAGTGNVNILNCEISGTFTKSSNATYTTVRLCDMTAANITGSGLVSFFGGNPNTLTVNNAAANVIVKGAVSVSPVLTAGSLNIVDSVVVASGTYAISSAASSFITLANSQILVSALNNVAPVSLLGFYSIFNCVYDKPGSILAAASGTGGSTNSIDYFQYINADKFITQGGTSTQYVKGDGSLDSTAKADAVAPIISINSATAFTSADNAKIFHVSGTTALTLPAAGTIPDGWSIGIVNVGGQTITISRASTNTINGTLTTFSNTVSYSAVYIYKASSTEFVAIGVLY
jgi:hypothetical protein